MSGDPAARGILQDFLRFAIDNATSTSKELHVSYYYLDQAGNIIEPSVPGDVSSPAKIVEKVKDPTKQDIKPETTSVANFASLLPANLADLSGTERANLLNNDVGAWIAGTPYGSNKYDDVFGVNSVIFRPWELFGMVETFDYPDLIAIPPSASSSNNRPANNIFNTSNQYAKAYATANTTTNGKVADIAVAKLPILWLKASDESYVKVWDMLDPWDYQVLVAMLAKEVNSDSSYDSLLGTKRVWETVMDNIDAAFSQATPLAMDCFGNIVTRLGGKSIVVIPAAYNKHLTTKPMVNLVNSLFLTGPTSGVSSDYLLNNGKMPVKALNWWISNDNEAEKNRASSFGPGMPAFGWKGTSMPNNAVALYFDSDSLSYMTYKDRQKSSAVEYYETAIDFQGYKMFPQVAAVLGVLDLDLNGNRSFTRGSKTDLITPRLMLTGISKAAGLGTTDSKPFESRGAGIKSLMTNITFQEGLIGLLPSAYNEAEVEYAQTMVWQHAQTPILGSPVVIPVAMEAGKDGGKTTWAYLARDFVNYYGTEYYPKNKGMELNRLSKLLTNNGTQQMKDNNVFVDFTRKLMYDADKRPALPIIMHAKTANMTPFINLIALGDGNTYLNIPNWGTWLESQGFIWRESSYLKESGGIKTSWFNAAGGELFARNFASMTQRWVKAYPTNKVLTNVASYLGMRGDSEFAAAAAPYVYLSYLNMYGVGTVDGNNGVNVSTLNKNPTKFNEKIFDAKSSPVFTYNPADNNLIKSKDDMVGEVTINIWKLLSPTSGHEYKRQLISNMIGNFVYDQYMTTVFGGTMEYYSGGVQQTVTKSQTGFLRFPSLEDNVFTRWFYQDYATVAIVLLSVGLIFIIILGVFRGRKFTWFFLSLVLLVSSVVLIPFVNDIASNSMDNLVSKILKDKTTLWSMTEYIANDNMVEDYITVGLSPEEAEIAADITKSLSLAYTDRTLVLKQDISHKVVSLGNYSAYQQFASTRWMLPMIMRQFTAEDNSNAYVYIPLVDIAEDAANAYWWYNPADAQASGRRLSEGTNPNYAVGTQQGVSKVQYTFDTIQKFYPQYHWVDTSLVYGSLGQPTGSSPETKAKLSYRSISQSVTGGEPKVVPIHDFIYIYMNNAYTAADPAAEDAQQVPLLPLKDRPALTQSNAKNHLYWGDPVKIEDSSLNGGKDTYLSNLYGFEAGLPAARTVLGHTDPDDTSGAVTMMNHNKAKLVLFQLAQKYNRTDPSTMYGEFAYLWSTETQYPYFYALVKDTMEAAGIYDYQTGTVNNAATENPWYAPDRQLGVLLNALTGMPVASGGGTALNADLNKFFGATRTNFMYQSGVTGMDLVDTFDKALLPAGAAGSTQPVFTGYVRDILDLESMFHNVIPYMYQMSVVTGGLTGDHDADKGLYGSKLISDSQYKIYSGLPESWLFRTNWATKIVEAPAYNKPERIGYWVGDTKVYDEVTMTYFPDAYHAVKDGGRDMVFSEAQMKMMGLDENDLTTLELKLIRLNKDIAKRWTSLINYINVNGMTSEVMVRQMALEATLAFNEIVTPSGLGNTAFSLMPSIVDLRSLSFDTIMRVVLLNTSKDTNFFGTAAMESVITNFGLLSGVLLLVVTWVCIYGVTIVRAFFIAFLFLMGVLGVARGVFASNASKKATLFGYLTSIGILYAITFLYYQVFNVLMIGADSTSYVNSGLQGASATPTIALIIILVASLIYIWLMYKMFRLALSSVLSGSFDLGLDAYKEKAHVGMAKVSRGINNLRMGHAYEDMDTQMSLGGSSAGLLMQGSSGGNVSGGSRGKRKRRETAPSGSGSGSGSGSRSRALQSGSQAKSSRALSALDDHESVDAAIARAGNPTPPTAPSMTLEEYLSTPTKTEKKNKY